MILAVLILILSGCDSSQSQSTPVQATKAVQAISQNSPSQEPTLDVTKVAFMGDSITDFWDSLADHLPNYINAGVGGNTTPMMLARFDSAVMASNAQTVVILGGVNDIRTVPNANTNDILSMALEAFDSGRTVILGELLPVSNWFSPDVMDPEDSQAALKAWNIQIHWIAGAYGLKIAEYNAPMSMPDGSQITGYFKDGLHPNEAGYAVMWKVLAPLLPPEAGAH